MDDLGSKLESILNDPDSMERVRRMAQSLLSDDDTDAANSDPGGTQNPFSSADIGRIMSILSKIEGGTDDNRTRLLLALKPHLTDRRREKVDSAIKMLKLVEALPLLKEAGIFDLG